MGQHTINPRLGINTSPPHHTQYIREIIAKQGVATPLGEKSDHGGDVNTLPHPGCFQHVPPRLPGIFELSFYGGSDLGHLSTDKEGISVTLGMIFHENLKCFVVSVFADEISRTLRQQAGYLADAMSGVRGTYNTKIS